MGIPATSEVADGITAVDTRMAGRARVTSAYLLAGSEPTLIETGPNTSSRSVIQTLESLGLGPEDLAHVVVTHIHLDHAGGAGTLARRFTEATFWAHDRGAPHLADPTKLVESAGRVYGPQRLRELFGPVEPVPADRLRAVSEGDRIDLGGRQLEVIYTPGHASHHVALVDSTTGAVFAGDALGIHLPDVRVLRPATPPPDIDIELAIESIERIRSRARSMLMFSHFGPVTEVDELCELAGSRLRKWAGIVRAALDTTDDLREIAAVLERGTADEFDDAMDPRGDLERYEILSSMEMNAAGLVRYWRKLEERASGQPASGEGPQSS